jgi:hypothetical protein
VRLVRGEGRARLASEPRRDEDGEAELDHVGGGTLERAWTAL